MKNITDSQKIILANILVGLFLSAATISALYQVIFIGKKIVAVEEVKSQSSLFKSNISSLPMPR